MWDKSKTLTAAILFTALLYKVTSQSAKLLAMAPDAVDGLYSRCRKQALEKFIHSGQLRVELNNSKELQEAWSSTDSCSKLIPGKLKEHTAALWLYTSAGKLALETFDRAVETLGTNSSTYEHLFHFKSLHFLLMDSMSLQPPEKCKTFFICPEVKYTATKGSQVRFGRFIVVYPSDSVLKDVDLDEQVVFKITSCFFASLGPNVCSEEDSVLLSPAEEFTVEDVRKVTNANDAEYTEVTLKHSQVTGSDYCSVFSRSPADVSTQWPVLAAVASSLFFLNC